MKRPEHVNPQGPKADRSSPEVGRGKGGMESNCLMGMGFPFGMVKMSGARQMMFAQYCE